jgi:hypothetical protein
MEGNFMLPRTRLPDITPIAFCREIKSLATGLSPKQIIMAECDRGIFKEYSLILSRELDVPLATVKSKWGAGIEFPNMPKRFQSLLKFVLHSRVAIAKQNIKQHMEEFWYDREKNR